MSLLLLASLSAPALAAGPEDRWEFSLDGFYRTRAYLYHDLYESDGDGYWRTDGEQPYRTDKQPSRTGASCQ